MSLPRAPSFRFDGKFALVADASSGVGLACAVAQAEAGAHVVVAARSDDALVNSARLARHTPALDTVEADFGAVADLNVRGAYFLTQAVAKDPAAGRPGSLINISSQMDHVGGVDRAVYSSIKHSVEGFTKAMATELRPMGIQVNPLCPTFILATLTKPTFDNPERAARIKEDFKPGRRGEIEDIMGAVVFLAYEASALVTGSALMVDGG